MSNQLWLKILKLFGFTIVRCRVCNKLTEPCISLPGIKGYNICSFECVLKEENQNESN